MVRGSENILHRLFDRQISRGAPSTQIHRVRQFYENIVPNFTVHDVECPDHYFRKFSNDGQYLICFGRNGQDLIIYRHKWLTYCTNGESSVTEDEFPLKGKKFESYFSKLYSVKLASGNELTCKDFFLATDCNCFGIFATATVPDNDSSAIPGAVPGVPSIERITLYLVKLADGTIVDERIFQDDFIHLAHNTGVFMYDDLLAILSVRYQLIHILQVRETGIFVDVCTIGTHCREDDELVLNDHAQVELMFHRKQSAHCKAKGLAVDSMSMWPVNAQMIPVSKQGWPVREHYSSWESSDGPSSSCHNISGDPCIGRSFEEYQSADMDTHGGYFRELHNSGLQNAVVTAGHGQKCVRIAPVDFEADEGGESTGGYFSSTQKRLNKVQAENRHFCFATPHGSASFLSVMGTAAQYGTSCSIGSDKSDTQTCGIRRSLYYSSSSDTASHSWYRGSGVAAGYGDSSLGDRYPSDGSIEYVISSRVSAGASALSQHAEGSALGTSLPPGECKIDTQRNILGSRQVDIIGIPGRATEPLRGSGEESRQNGAYIGESSSGNARIYNQILTTRNVSGGEVQAFGNSTSHIATSVRSNANVQYTRPVQPGLMDNPVVPSQLRPGNGDESLPVAGRGGQNLEESKFLGGIKQRLLSFIFRSIWNQDTDSIIKAQNLQRFYYHFQHYVDLVMWKVQFLDRYHLLIKFGSADGVVPRNSEASHQTAFFAVYNLESTEVVGFYQNSSDDFLQLYEHFCDHFRVAPCYPLYMRFISSYSNNPFSRQQLRDQKAAYKNCMASAYAQVVKRMLASLPHNSQSQIPSAYFDQSLFRFDEKLISATDRHRPCMEHPIKFISKRKPNSLKFKINPGFEHGSGDVPVNRVSFVFHPFFPFAMSVQQSIMQSPFINLHFRR
eukprot:c29072_g2_i1 orf=417-3116(-)